MADLLTWLADPARRRPLLRLLVAAQVCYVLGVAGAGYATARFGQHLVLRAAPINPDDLRTGDFVRLRYTIGEVPLGLWRETAAPRRRQAVFVLLASGSGNTATAVGVYAAAPQPAGNQVVLRGWITNVYRRALGLRFNLERYYVPAASPLRREKPGRAHPLWVQVSIAPWGQARIAGVEMQQTKAPEPGR